MRWALIVALLAVAVAMRPAVVAQTGSDATFSEWLADVRSEALARGIRQEIVDGALAGLKGPLANILERDRTQAEAVQTLETYLSRRLTSTMTNAGRRMLTRHRALLGQVEAAYGVPSPIVVAIWGLESNYGRVSGARPTVPALATLAWDPRRSTFFRRELFNALEILNRGDIELSTMKGSWAGAMGQPQFMPSSYLQYAEDFDGDGRRDIWGSHSDIFASIANYLKGRGWVPGERWGREVQMSPEVAQRIAVEVGRRTGACRATREMTVALPLAAWQRFGVRSLGDNPFPSANMSASLVSGTSQHFIVYQNYDAILEYNCAHSYALSVALLGDRVSR